MAIVHRIDKDGALIVGDTESRITVYSYPSSANAEIAKRMTWTRLATFAAQLVKDETRHGFAHEKEYDDRNWERLEA